MSHVRRGNTITKPRLWLVTNADDQSDVHDWVALSTVPTKKHSTFELFEPRNQDTSCIGESRPGSRDVSSTRSSTPPPLPERAPGHSKRPRRAPPLRKKHSPTLRSLREIRDKQSEMALRKAYESQTMNYLNDSIGFERHHQSPGSSRWSCSESSSDNDLDEEDEDVEFVLAPENWWSSSPIFAPRPYHR